MKAWCPELGDEIDAREIKPGAFLGPDFAAEEFAEDYCSRACEYPDDMLVNVRDDAGELHEFEVTLEQTIVYSAHPVRTIPPVSK